MCLSTEAEMALYAQQDDMMEWGHAHMPVHSKPANDKPLKLAPGVVQGPFTHDSQEHHDWEVAEANALLGKADISRLSLLAKVAGWVALTAFVLGFLYGLPFIDWGHVLTAMWVAR